jgi:hypothetical protein
MKRYNIINNSLGWLCFVIAAITYLLTIEPTASFWDCPEFISQGFKLEVGHPPGNPIFMLTARFFVTLFGGGAQTAAIAVNSMSALLSAGTILLLFWTITHLIKRLTVKDDATEISWLKTALIMGGGLCGALAYTWSDTFWFSAVEGEVYAFSSFCTALVFWLILKWENRAELPHSDRYLVLIAYVIGVSIAVHLLNLLCIPAIGLIFYYKKFKNPSAKGSLIALAVSAAVVGLILYGLVPGFIAVAQRFELLFVNGFGFGYNVGVFVYAVLTVAVFVWTIKQLYDQSSAVKIKIGVFLSIVISGLPFIGHGAIIPCILIIGLIVYLWGYCKQVPVRVFNVLVQSIFVIFIGYSSYALLLIRATSDTPMNQNAPDNVFALSSYLNREQYGDNPLIYGQTVAEELKMATLGYDEDNNPVYGVEVDANGYPQTQPVKGIMYDNGTPIDIGSDNYTKIVKTDADQPDEYVKESHSPKYQYSSDITMFFPRMYSPDPKLIRSYKSWAEYTNPDFEAIPVSVRQQWAQRGYVTDSELRPYLNNMIDINQGTYTGDYGEEDYSTQGWKMGFMVNLRYFLNYQLNHMYWRYFMWNFAGRQNDIQGNGEPHLGNWISGIPAIDNMRLGNQSQLPDEFGKGNKGHNVFYMLPLLLGLLGLLWQALSTRHTNPTRGIEQFWVVFFLFFMTGIAIVLYLNQTPCQPRERDYAFAGSFYAFAIWIGLGVPALASLLNSLIQKVRKSKDEAPEKAQLATAAVAIVIGIAVPLQMVSQTWDDHDRSGRYTCRDFGMNYLNSLDDNAIIFTNGDNDTFPLWYAQEVEGCRTDVKVVNLSYLATEWYANQVRKASYDADGVPMYARPQDYAYDQFWMQHYTDQEDSISALPITAEKSLTDFYSGKSESAKRLRQKYGMTDEEGKYMYSDINVYAPQDSAAVFKAFGRYPETADSLHHGAYMDLMAGALPRSAGLTSMLAFDIVAKSATDGWKRPVYFATTVPSSYYLGFEKYMYITGMAQQVTPFYDKYVSPVADKAYQNIMSRFKWGNLDSGKDLYLDETVRRMVSSTRLAVLEVVESFLNGSKAPASAWAKAYARKHNQPVPATRADMARNLLQLIEKRMPGKVAPYESMLDLQMAESYGRLWALTGDARDLAEAKKFNDACIERYGQLVRYATTLTPGERSRLGSSERTALNYLTIAIAFDNYFSLRQAAAKDKKVDAEVINMLDNTMSITDSYEAYDWIYLRNLSDEHLNQLAEDAGYYDRSVAVAQALKLLHSDYAINPQAVTEKVAKKLGISLNDWRKVVSGR